MRNHFNMNIWTLIIERKYMNFKNIKSKYSNYGLSFKTRFK